MKMKYAPLFALISGLLLSGCGKNKTEIVYNHVEFPAIHEVKSNYFAVNPFTLNLGVGATEKISVESIPAELGSGLKYTSKNKAVASVDANGYVTGVSKGICEIEVASKNNEATETIQVIVSDLISNTDGAAILKKKAAAVSDPSFEKKTKFIAHEYVKQTLTVGGKDVNSAAYVEDIIYSQEDAYFEVSSDDIMIKTADGKPELASGKWVFFVDEESYDTYLCHETPTSKNYMEVHTQKYLGRPAYKIILDVLDMFFLSGSDIVLDSMEDLNGEAWYDEDSAMLIDCAEHEYGNASEEIYQGAGEDLYCSLTLTQTNDEISAKEEFSIEIPAGTKYDGIDTYDLLIQGNYVKGMNLNAEMTFEYEGQDAKRVFTKNTRFITDFAVSYPDLNQFGLVDSIYDL